MGTIKKSIKCSKCEYCRGFRPAGIVRTSFFCNHPDTQYIHDFFVKKGIKKMERFLGYGDSQSDTVPMVYSPTWCPKKITYHLIFTKNAEATQTR